MFTTCQISAPRVQWVNVSLAMNLTVSSVTAEDAGALELASLCRLVMSVTFCQRTTYSRIPIQAFLQLIFGHHTYIFFWLQTLQNSHIIFVLNLFNSHHMCCRPQRRKLWLQATQNKANFHKAIPWKDRFKPSTLIRGDNILSKVRPLLCVMWYCSSRGPDVQYIRGVLWSCLASQQG